MKPFLSEARFRNLEKLSRAVRLLCRTRIHANDMREAGNLLQEFGIEFAQLYGKSNVVMNVHLLATHLVESCRNFGPLWVFWCYPYENMLGAVKKFIHGTKNPEKSFIFGAHIIQLVPTLEHYEFQEASTWNNLGTGNNSPVNRKKRQEA